MRIFFISSLDFTANGAAQNRQQQMICDLQALGHAVQLINPVHPKPAALRFPTAGLSRGMPRRLAAVALVLGVFRRQARKGDLVICFDRTQLTLLPALAVARLRGLLVLHEITEYPAETMRAGMIGALSLFLFERFSLPRLDGVLVISRALQSYVTARAPKARIFRIPALAVSQDRWTNGDEARQTAVTAISDQSFTFLYAGSLVERKDGVLSLIAAFAMAFGAGGSARLVVLGYGSAAQNAAVRAAIVAHGVADRVTLRDPVPQADLSAWLLAADALVLCRPLSRQASYGFPTKLVEYLSTGRPVIVTATSDIGYYLRDGVSAFLVPPNDLSAFAQAMRRAESDRDSAAQIGQGGLTVFRSEFESRVAVGRLADWLLAEFSPAKERR